MKEINKLINTGFELHKKGDFKNALNCYLKANRNDNSQLLFLIGNTYLQLNQIDKSVKFFKDCISIDPNNIAALNNLGGAFQSLKDYNKAI